MLYGGGGLMCYLSFLFILIPVDLADHTPGSQHFLSLAYCYTGDGLLWSRGGGGASCVEIARVLSYLTIEAAG